MHFSKIVRNFQKKYVLTKLLRIFLFNLLTTFKKMFRISKNVLVSKIVRNFKKSSVYSILCSVPKKMFEFFCSGFKKHFIIFKKCTTFCLCFQNLFGVLNFVRDFQKMFTFPSLFIFSKNCGISHLFPFFKSCSCFFIICLCFQKIVRRFNKWSAFQLFVQKFQKMFLFLKLFMYSKNLFGVSKYVRVV